MNVVALAGHGTLRLQTVGGDDRPASPNELGEMRRLLRDAVEQGAAGLSAGLTYAPGMYADDDELVALCEVLRGTGAVYMPHHRNYGAHALEAYRDSIEIARQAGVPLHLAHCHLGFPQNRGRAPELLAMLDAARADGVEVTLDTYPYLAGSTYLHAFLPGWAMEGGAAATIARLRDPALRERLRHELEDVGTDGHHGIPMDWSLVVTGGRSIADRAAEAGRRPVDVYCELVADGGLALSATHHVGNEENVRAIMQHPCHTGGSDGILVGEVPHPRGWGTFPRYLAVYVRELGPAPPGGRGPPLHVAARADPPPARPRAAPARDGGRRDVLRCRRRARHRHVRGAALAARRHPARRRERRAGDPRRRAHRRDAGPRAPLRRAAAVAVRPGASRRRR